MQNARDPRMLPNGLPILTVDLQHEFFGLLALKHLPASKDCEKFVDKLVLFALLMILLPASGHELTWDISWLWQRVKMSLQTAHRDICGSVCN